MGTTNVPSNGIWGSHGCQKPSEYVQGLIGVILLALNTLKNERILPTEANIADCIRYGDPSTQNTDVKKALESAIEQQMYSKATWDGIQNFSNIPCWTICDNGFSMQCKEMDHTSSIRMATGNISLPESNTDSGAIAAT
ncbi:hypothetical protein CK203_043703 [Vitis vinifera]|uniref:DUF7625 domain-containing protein n=1 Tax=Vitis vinifera TaxID=29760 RepID=A0A438GYT4_VITVI|nr:hypothetical protein CK203_043703 [Vitis vinifera]